MATHTADEPQAEINLNGVIYVRPSETEQRIVRLLTELEGRSVPATTNGSVSEISTRALAVIREDQNKMALSLRQVKELVSAPSQVSVPASLIQQLGRIERLLSDQSEIQVLRERIDKLVDSQSGIAKALGQVIQALGRTAPEGAVRGPLDHEQLATDVALAARTAITEAVVVLAGQMQDLQAQNATLRDQMELVLAVCDTLTKPPDIPATTQTPAPEVQARPLPFCSVGGPKGSAQDEWVGILDRYLADRGLMQTDLAKQFKLSGSSVSRNLLMAAITTGRTEEFRARSRSKAKGQG